MLIILAILVVSAALSAGILRRFDRALIGALLGLCLGPFGVVVAAIMRANFKAAEQQRATDARLAAMLRATSAAAKKAAAAPNQALSTAHPLPRGAAIALVSPEPAREERECPFCAEKILIKARVCKHCQRDVDPLL